MIGYIQDKLDWHLSTWLIISLFCLNFLDFQTTFWLMEYKGLGEANPLLDYFISVSGTTWAILWFKLFVLSVLTIPYLLVLEWRESCQKQWMIWALGLMNFYYSYIVIFNLNLILI